MTNGWTDVANTDVVLVMGGNPAENHPVGFRFVMEAKRKRKARLVCIDPRFNRTAAVSDLYVPIRSGSDIAFLGGLIHHILSRDLHHEDYVKLHTNAPFLVKEGFSFSEGLFSGWDEAKRGYDKSSWQYQLDSQGHCKTDPKLEHPQSVFQLLKQHYSRYTPERVASICGCTAEQFHSAAEVICSTGRADRRGTILYALGWTQHSHSVQLIHAAAMMQLLLGNMGVPGGGVNAQRGHSNIQGATDMGAWNKLPGYLNLPQAHQTSLSKYLEETSPTPLSPGSVNYWKNTSKFMGSLLKAFYGNAATADNEYSYHNLPKIGEGEDHSWAHLFDRMLHGSVEGLVSFGMNPVANGPNSTKMIAALSRLKWLVVAECFDTETSSFWRSRELAGEYYPGAPEAAEIDTEVFLLPAACSAEKDGTFVNSSRWLQWKWKALDPPGQARPDQEIIARLFLKLRELYRNEGGTAADPLLDISWPYQNQAVPDQQEVAREINGQDSSTGRQLSSFADLKDDGSTLCGNWLYSGSYPEAGNLMAWRGQDDPSGLGFYHDWSWNWPLNRRVLYNRASADAEGQPWDPTRAGIRWTGKRWVGDIPDFGPTAEPDSAGAFIMLPEGVAKLFATDFAEGPFPEHYEPAESPVANALHPAVSGNPMVQILGGDLDPLGDAKDYPYVAVTFRLTEHFHYWTKHIDANSQLQPNFFVELPHELASQKGIQNKNLCESRRHGDRWSAMPWSQIACVHCRSEENRYSRSESPFIGVL